MFVAGARRGGRGGGAAHRALGRCRRPTRRSALERHALPKLAALLPSSLGSHARIQHGGDLARTAAFNYHMQGIGGERRRLLAAVLTREAALFVCGGAFSQSAVRSEELVANALAKLAKHLGSQKAGSILYFSKVE